MASLSISGTNSLGNTSLRGFGGLASGIDRDAIIEQMSLGTQTKIDNHKSKMTKLEWKRDAYRSVTDMTLDLQDKYFSYASSSTLKDPSLFGKTEITVNGSDASKRFVTATGSSDLIDTISIKGVKQTATSTVLQSNRHAVDTLKTGAIDLGPTGRKFTSSLKGTQLDVGIIQDKAFGRSYLFEFKEKYTDDNGEEQTINYTPEENEDAETFAARLVGELNSLAKSEQLQDKISFTAVDGKISVELKGEEEYVVRGNSTALDKLGFKSGDNVTEETMKNGATDTLWNTAIKEKLNSDIISGKKMVFEYDGVQKSVELFTKEDAKKIQEATDEASRTAAVNEAVKGLQERLDWVFGTATVEDGKVTNGIKVGTDVVDGKYQFTFTTREGSTASLLSSDNEFLNALGVDLGESNKVNVSGKLDQAALGLKAEDYADDKGNLALKINGVSIGGITKDSTIGDILNKINNNKDAGVRATYVDSTGQFMLVSSETGSGRSIKLDSDLAKDLFGGTEKLGQDAIVRVSYGNGVDVDIKRASNTFSLEGLTVTVSGEFGFVKDGTGGYVTDSTGKEVVDTSQQVTFTAKANVDKAVETVKSFFEDFNKLVTEVRTQVTTRPDSSYGPLTSAQKAEMDETSIENWEKKAKAGILYGDDVMRDFSGALEGIMGSFLRATGYDYEELKDMGISYSDDYLDGGTLVFDEVKFRRAMEQDPDKVAKFMAGGKSGNGGLASVIEGTLTPYATRYASKNGNSYGRLVEVAGTEKKPTTLMSNQIYKQLKDMQADLDKLNTLLKTEQDRYIKQFSTMESLINTMNTQSSYLSQLTA